MTKKQDKYINGTNSGASVIQIKSKWYCEDYILKILKKNSINRGRKYIPEVKEFNNRVAEVLLNQFHMVPIHRRFNVLKYLFRHCYFPSNKNIKNTVGRFSVNQIVFLLEKYVNVFQVSDHFPEFKRELKRRYKLKNGVSQRMKLKVLLLIA